MFLCGRTEWFQRIEWTNQNMCIEQSQQTQQGYIKTMSTAMEFCEILVGEGPDAVWYPAEVLSSDPASGIYTVGKATTSTTFSSTSFTDICICILGRRFICHQPPSHRAHRSRS